MSPHQRKHKRYISSISCLLIGLGCALSTNAQQATVSGSDFQFWPEVDVSIKLSQRVSVLGMGTLHFGKNGSDLSEEQAGVGFNFTMNKYFSFGTAYRYAMAQPPGRSHTREHRFFLDFTGRAPLKDGFVLSDRNRFEFRRINGIESHRYRNKLQLERSFTIADRNVTPYLAGEVFYDDRFHIWNRTRIYAGVRVPLNQHLTLDPYFLEQFDVRDRPFERRHVIAINLRIDY
jgi:hypothetical protein